MLYLPLNSPTVLWVKYLDIFSTDFKPDVVMFSGLHLLDSSALDKQNEKVSALTFELSKLPRNIPIHLELASMANEQLVHLIADKVR